MLQKKYIRKDRKYRFLFLNCEKKKQILKFLIFSHHFYILNQKSLIKKIYFLIFSLKKFSQTLIRNRCIFSGRSRSVYKKLKISRLMLKLYVNNTFMSMFNKANN